MRNGLDEIKARLEDSVRVKQALLSDVGTLGALQKLVERSLFSLRSGGKIIFCGNGGSFADAQHLSAEFTSRFMFDRDSLPSLALGTNSSAMSAIGNDYGYEHVFSRELASIAHPADVLVAISTSGNSVNVLNAIAVAKEKNLFVSVMTGASHDLESNFSDINILAVPSQDTARIQECHIVMGHILCELLKEIFTVVSDS